MPKVHIIEPGSRDCHVLLSNLGITATIYERVCLPVAGAGLYDRSLGCEINNGNHLLFSSNQSTLKYLNLIGSSESWKKFPASFTIERATGKMGHIPWPEIFSRGSIIS